LICEFIYILENPVDSYIEQLEHDAKNALTYKWVGPGKKEYSPDLRKRFRANRMLGRVYGLYGYDKNFNRDIEKAVLKHIAKPQADLKFLMEDRIVDYGERYEMWKNIKRENEEAEKSESSSVRAKQ